MFDKKSFMQHSTKARLLIAGLLLGLMTHGSARADADLLPWSGSAAEAPALELDAWRGGQQSLADYRGKVVLVNFWASWCHPCLQEIPELISLGKKLADRPFIIFAVNVGEERRRLPGFVRTMDRSMQVLLDPKSEVFEHWPGQGFPSSYLVDTSGRIRFEAYGPVDWDGAAAMSDIRMLLDEAAGVAVETQVVPKP